MKKLIFKNFLMLIAFFAVATLSSAESLTSNHPKDRCRFMHNEDARTNCYQLERVNRKLSKVLHLLNRGSYQDDHRYVKEYSCIGGGKYNGKYAGYGATSKLAMDDYMKFCTIAWSKKWCGQALRSCDLEEYNVSTHFNCEVGRFKGVGKSKKEAKLQAFRMCEAAYGQKYCARSFKKCSIKE